MLENMLNKIENSDDDDDDDDDGVKTYLSISIKAIFIFKNLSSSIITLT